MKKTLFLPILFLALIASAQQETAFTTAKKYYQEENYQEALKYFDLAAREEPGNAQVPYFAGRLQLDMSNYKESAALLEKAVSMDSTRSNWIYELGLVYYAMPDYKKSLYYIQLAGEKGYRKTNDYLENLGNAYINAGELEKGAGILKEVLNKKPQDRDLLYQVAQAYYNAGKYAEAIDYWDQLFGLDKTNAEVLYMIGMSYQKKGDKQQGQQLCDKAIQMDPSLKSKRQQRGGGPL